MSYSSVDSKTVDDLYGELLAVYSEYSEYHEDGFSAMVNEFASDDFYKLHFVAIEYLKRVKA
jgi:hypothetical protein